jgi:hypothetical protein
MFSFGFLGYFSSIGKPPQCIKRFKPHTLNRYPKAWRRLVKKLYPKCSCASSVWRNKDQGSSGDIFLTLASYINGTNKTSPYSFRKPISFEYELQLLPEWYLYIQNAKKNRKERWWPFTIANNYSSVSCSPLIRSLSLS